MTSGGRLPMEAVGVLCVIATLTGLTSGGDGGHRGRGLTMGDLEVPPVADVREDATLRCHFDTGALRLYSVKWYKDEFEFFRYTPDKRPPSQTFPVPGVSLKEALSSKSSVTLTALSFASSGTYRCEVSTEAPNFETVFKNANMTVMALPLHDPMIEGVRSSYSIGDTVLANCTSAASNPPATLEWYINGIKAERWLLDQMPVDEDGFQTLAQHEQTVEEWVERAMPVHEEAHAGHGLVARTRGLAFAAERRFFQATASSSSSAADEMELRCVARVGGRERRRVVVSALNTAPSARTLSAGRHADSALVSSPCCTAMVILVCSLMTAITS